MCLPVKEVWQKLLHLFSQLPACAKEKAVSKPAKALSCWDTPRTDFNMAWSKHVKVKTISGCFLQMADAQCLASLRDSGLVSSSRSKFNGSNSALGGGWLGSNVLKIQHLQHLAACTSTSGMCKPVKVVGDTTKWSWSNPRIRKTYFGKSEESLVPKVTSWSPSFPLPVFIMGTWSNSRAPHAPAACDVSRCHAKGFGQDRNEGCKNAKAKGILRTNS